MSFPILAYPKSPQSLCLSASLISCLSVSVWLFDCVSLPPCLRTRCLIIVCPSWCLQTTWSRCGWVILSLYSYWFPILFSFTLLSSKETVACGWGPLTNVALWKKKRKKPSAAMGIKGRYELAHIWHQNHSWVPSIQPLWGGRRG